MEFDEKRQQRGGASAAPETVYVVELNAHLRALDRAAVFEDPIDDTVRSVGGEIVGGGTLQEANGEPVRSDIEITVPGVSDTSEAAIIGALEALGAPKGSHLVAPGGGRRIPFGVVEGMGVYLDGVNLPAHVYAEGDVNAILERFADMLGDRGHMLSYWEGPKETALYYYGPSFEDMADAIAPVLAEYPLLEGCRIVRIA